MNPGFKALLIFFFISVLFTISVQAQADKQEVEKSIKKDEMPSEALRLIEKYFEEYEDIDFFEETDGQIATFEAKLEWKGYRYSIEFSEEGILLDIEQLIDISEIDDQLRTAIIKEIEDQYTKYEITRIQRQYPTDKTNQKIEAFLNGDFEDLILRYELEIDGQNRKELGSFELLFDDGGALLQKRKIIRRSIDNIW